ncbi:HlyD family efflux transporter periplasmic adaptor subunit [Marivivens sp. LCG002]|uniref:efflux RND transporter periplasmic adaptor subunit n=1 Tax=Marivivens sp. LCG002 TaxID=3051171 RepID=UPI002555249D|nr:HlyD family efflux transporter periplasmic adaptor subunit [Marivivens sp. LCG002]WIV50546.1 HlyD family efflux transporter periplasmic adaptor subunit [Marivivens sp. LCG002]
MRFLRRSLTGIFLLAMTLVLLAVAGNTVRLAVQERMNQEPRSFPQRERVSTVNVVEITPATIEPVLTVFGEVKSRRTLAIRAAIGGTVLETSDDFIDGGTVTAGQQLLRIDPVDAEFALTRAKADLQDAEAELRDAERALVLANDSLSAAQEQFDLRETALARARDLLARGAGTAAAVEAAELSSSAAQASLLNSRQSAAQAEARVDQARTNLARAKLNLDEAERTLADTTVTALFDGTLAEVGTLRGGRVTANEQLAQLIDPKALEVEFRVSTAQYLRLIDENGDLIKGDVKVTIDVADVSLVAAGKITRESASVGDGQTGRVLFAALEEAPGFRVGDFVTVEIIEPALENVASIPASALGADGTVLVIGEDSRLSLASVTLRRRQGESVIIDAGDVVGAKIVAERSPLLGAGLKVQAAGEAAPAPARPAAAPETASGDTIKLDAERKAKLVEFVKQSRMPDEAKTRILTQLEAEDVPVETVNRLEQRMGG